MRFLDVSGRMRRRGHVLELPCSTLPTRGRLEQNHDPARTALPGGSRARTAEKSGVALSPPRLGSGIVPTSAGELKGLQNIRSGSLPAISALSRSISRRGRSRRSRRATALGRHGPKADSCSAADIVFIRSPRRLAARTILEPTGQAP